MQSHPRETHRHATNTTTHLQSHWAIGLLPWKKRDPSQRQLNKWCAWHVNEIRCHLPNKPQLPSSTELPPYPQTAESIPRPPLIKGSPSLHAWPLVETQIHLMIKHVWRGGLIFWNICRTRTWKGTFVQHGLFETKSDVRHCRFGPGTIGTATCTTGTTTIPAPEAMSSACYLISDHGLDQPQLRK